MDIYHGTFDCFAKSILDEGKIDHINNIKSEDTILIDNFLEKALGYNPRGLCIYLTNDIDLVNGYDVGFKIPFNELNKNLLYVANNKLINDLFEELISNGETKKAYNLAEKYDRSVMSYDEYIEEVKNNNTLLEFMYFDSIYVSKDNIF